MIERPNIGEIERLVARLQKTRDTWRGVDGYARQLDIELHALHLLLIVTRIENEEINIAASLGGSDGWEMIMPHDQIGPKEAQLRAQREARVAENKAVIDKTTRFKAKGISKAAAVKAKRGGRRGR